MQDEDRKALRRLARGERGVFWIIWERYHQSLYQRCLQRLGGHPQNAEDALSEAMVKAWDRLPDCASEIGNLQAWLFQFVDYTCTNLWRKESRREPVEDLPLEDSLADPAADSPEEALLSQEKIETLLHLVDDLPPRLHDPFILYVFREMSYRDLAEQLHLSEEAACKRVQEARQVLRQWFQDYLSGTKENVAQTVLVSNLLHTWDRRLGPRRSQATRKLVGG
jgi:RNA polymerase sigma factor (sigma-70 family)